MKSYKQRKNIIFATLSNFLAAAVSAMLVLVLPKLLDTESYGYYQLFLFYNAYTPLAQIGWSEGIYLRYGGQYIEELKTRSISDQIKAFIISQIVIGILLYVIIIITTSYDKSFVLITMALSIAFTNVYILYQNILTAVGEIENYCNGILISKILLLCLSIILTICNIRDYKLYIIVIIVSDCIGSIYYIITYKTLLIRGFGKFTSIVKEARDNILVGVNLLIGNIASMLVMGVMRQGIEIGWSIATFGMVSLTIQASNFLQKFISAVGTVLFPSLRRMELEHQSSLYERLSTLVQSLCFVIFLMYYPINVIIVHWLPRYADAVSYMAVLFPMCLFESKTLLLGNTFLKTLRKENIIMIVNVIMVIISIIFSLVGVLLVKNLDFMIVCIVILLGIRTTVFEILIYRYLKLDSLKNVFEGIVISVVFVISNWIIGGIAGVLLYSMSLVFYIISEFRSISDSLSQVVHRADMQ